MYEYGCSNKDQQRIQSKKKINREITKFSHSFFSPEGDLYLTELLYLDHTEDPEWFSFHSFTYSSTYDKRTPSDNGNNYKEMFDLMAKMNQLLVDKWSVGFEMKDIGKPKYFLGIEIA